MKNLYISLFIIVLSIVLFWLTSFGYILLSPIVYLLFLTIQSTYRFIKYDIRVKNAKLITIKKNRRRGEWRFIPFIYLGLKPRILKYRFNFNKNCLYKLDYNPDIDEEDDNGDINKLIGFTHLFVHWYSQRFGFNVNKEQTRINLHAYFYNKKIRGNEFLRQIDVNENVDIMFVLQNGSVRYYINDCFFEENKIPKIIIGYRNYSYFGGTKRANQDMQFYRTKLR